MGPLIPPDHSPTMQHLFPILNLPDLPFRSVYGHLEFVDLIHLASFSKRMKSIIATMEKKQKELTELYLTITKSHQLYDLNNGRSGRKKFQIHQLNGIYLRHDVDILKILKVCGRDWKINTVSHGWRLESSIEALLFWFQFLKELFNCRITIDFLFDNNLFGPLFVNTNLFHTADKISISHSFFDKFSDFEMTHMLDNFETQHLEIVGRHNHAFKYNKLLTKFPKIVLQEPYWLKIEDVWNMVQGGVRDVRFIENVSWSAKAVNHFIKNWLDSDNNTFEVIRFDASLPCRAYCIRTALDGITTTPGHKKRKDSAKYYDESQDYENGRDIRRKDGLLATFCIKEPRFFMQKMSFTVWYCLDPNVADNN